MQVFTSRNVQGSSPHTRGALEAVGGHVDVPGIIPAYAGSTHRASWSVSPQGDHPRIRGEHIRGMSVKELKAGSSPHTRGAQAAPLGGVQVRGIIPAYAGSTCWR